MLCEIVLQVGVTVLHVAESDVMPVISCQVTGGNFIGYQLIEEIFVPNLTLSIVFDNIPFRSTTKALSSTSFALVDHISYR